MARRAHADPRNVAGTLYVDDACISCDTCRQLAPATFGGAEDDTSFVCRQPEDDATRRRALLALVSCPVAAIGADDLPGAAVRAAAAALPEEVAPGIHACGWAARDSYGASAWLIVRAGGNVLVDSPRAARPLLTRLRALGGVRFMFLTHRDDVADHELYARELGAQRIVHEADAGAVPGAEIVLRGREPTRLADDLVAIPVPGHTRGSAALLWRDEALFTGDHLWWTDEPPGLEMGRGVCWYSWREQVASLERLRAHRFSHVLPGHGRRFRATSPAAMREALEAALARARATQ